MKIHIERMAQKMIPHGFQLGFFDEKTFDIVFIRSFSPFLFERIEIGQGWERGGRKGDLVSGSVACSIVPGQLYYKGMGEARCLIEIASENTGWSKLSNDADAALWEDRLALIGPQESHNMCVQHGSEILSTTDFVRHCGSECLAICKNIGQTPATLFAALQSQAKDWQMNEFQRLRLARIPCLTDGELYAEIAILTTILFSGNIKGDPRWFVGKEPDSWRDRELMNLILYMQSRLAGEIGWPEPFFQASL